MGWLQWLFSTQGFRAPGAYNGWSTPLLAVNIGSNIFLFLVYLTLAGLLALFRLRKGKPRLFQEARTSGWFTILFLVVAVTHAMQAIGNVWPALHLVVVSKVVAAVVSWVVVAFLVPITFAREIDSMHEERHDFANKVNLETLATTVNLKKIELLQEALATQQVNNTELTRMIAETARRLEEKRG